MKESRIHGENIVDVYDAIKQARQKAGLSLAEAGNALGITDASLSRLENRQSKLTTDRLVQLAKLYKASTSALLEGAVVTNPSSIDLDRLRAIIEEVEAVVAELKVRPTPAKIGSTITEIYRIEIERLVENTEAQFDPKRYISTIEGFFL